MPYPVRGTRTSAAAIIIEKARTVFYRSFTLARAFLAGAAYYAETGQERAAAFSLHQAAEQALRAFLLSITDYNAYGHDLRGLLRRCGLFGSCLFAPDEQPLLYLLNNAYMHTRYKPNYIISADELAQLLQKVAALHAQVRQCFEERVAAFEAFLLSNMKV